MATEDKTRVTVTIHGTQYKLMGQASKSPAYLQMVAAQVDEQMQKIATGAPHLDMPRIAVLTAVNIADELSKLKESLVMTEQEEGKQQRMREQQMDKLATELERLQQEVSSKAEQLTESKKQRDDLQQELHKLREEHRELQKELKQQFTQGKQDAKLEHNIHEEHEKLKEEYGKLQSEYNEWIQLFEREDPGT